MMCDRRSLPAALALLFTAMLPAAGADRFDWMPVASVGDGLRSDDLGGEMILPEIAITRTPKPTADAAQYTRVVELDLAAYGIHNDGTHAAETSRGLNQALQAAKAAGANRIVFPKGTYLVDEQDPILLDHRNTIIDLNGATLRIQPNGLPRYSLIEIIDGADGLRLTNGTLEGDRDEHDYKAAAGTHEWGTGVRFVSGRNLEVDHLMCRNMTGDGVSSGCTGTRNRDELLKRIAHSVYAKHLESGGFSDAGVKQSADKMRTIEPLDLAKCDGPFELGYAAGYMGYPFIKGRVYQAYFFAADGKFLERRKCLQYRKVTPPATAKWLHLEFNQPEVSEDPAHAGAVKGSWLFRITMMHPPTDVHFHHNRLVQNRRLGMAYCGGQRWVIEENEFAENGGTAPAYGVDFEDGSELMQDVLFRKNRFRGNRAGDLVVCAGSELIFEDNDFEKSVITWGRAHHYVFRRNQYRGGTVSYRTRTGVAEISDNRYENCKLAVVFDTKGVADGLVRKPGQAIATPPLRLVNESLVNVSDVAGTYFCLNNCDVRNTQFTVGPETRLVQLQGGKIVDGTLVYAAEGPPVEVQFDRLEGVPTETGPGLGRKQLVK